MIKKSENKKGQEEIVGFVLIIVLMAIILLVFLTISLRSPKAEERQDQIIYQFLESAMEQTTNCSLTPQSQKLKLDQLLKNCHDTNNECHNKERTCDEFNKTIQTLLDESWKIGPDYPRKGYELTIYYSVNNTNQQTKQEIYSQIKGSCNNTLSGNSYFLPSFPGSITTTLKMCY